MLLDGRTASENHRRFVERIASAEVVYYLSNENGVANSYSNDHEEDVMVLPFWSDAAYARRAESTFEESFEVKEIPLFEFLYRWLPGMTGDGVLAGTNWNKDLCGREIDPFDLRTEIEGVMGSELRGAYQERYLELTKEE